MTGQSTALLVMHAQPPLTEMVEDRSWIDRIADAIASARSHSVPVIYVKAGFRPGYPELDPVGPQYQQMSPAGLLINGRTDDVHAMLAPIPGDIEVVTCRVGAFTGTDLEILLRRLGVNHVVLSGISTGGVVLATFIGALERDISVTVLADAVTDADSGTHRALLAHFAAGAPWHGVVLCTDDWTAQLSADV